MSLFSGGSVGLQRLLKNSVLLKGTDSQVVDNTSCLRARLHRLRKISRFCLSEEAGGFSPLNKANRIKGL